MMVCKKVGIVRMGEAVAQEVDMQALAKNILSDQGLKRGERGGGLAIGDGRVTPTVDELPCLACDRVIVRHRRYRRPEAPRCRSREGAGVEIGGVPAEESGHHFGFTVAVDAFIEPRLLELVGRDHAIPVLVAKLVDSA